MLMSDLRRDYIQTRIIELDSESAASDLKQSLDELEQQARREFTEQSIETGKISFLRYGLFRYQNQAHSVEVLLPDGKVEASTIDKIRDTFHSEYEREYTYRLEAPVELVGFHVVASVDIGKLTPSKVAPSGRKIKEAVKAKRRVDYISGVHEAVIYDGDLLEPGMSFAGPAIVEESGSTTVVMPGMPCRVDDYGNLHIQTQKAGVKG
jgi:N-methylhydantoinase A